MTEPDVLQSGPTRPIRPPVVVALVALAAIVALLAIWATQNRPQPLPAPPPMTATAVPTPAVHRLAPGAIFIQTAVPGPEDAENRYFELYRDHQLLDSGFFVFQGDLQFSFQGQRGRFEIEGDHLVIHEPVRYLNWTWRRGTGDYAGFTGSGKAQFIYPKPELYGVLGQLSGTIRNASTGAPSPSHH